MNIEVSLITLIFVSLLSIMVNYFNSILNNKNNVSQIFASVAVVGASCLILLTVPMSRNKTSTCDQVSFIKKVDTKTFSKYGKFVILENHDKVKLFETKDLIKKGAKVCLKQVIQEDKLFLNVNGFDYKNQFSYRENVIIK